MSSDDPDFPRGYVLYDAVWGTLQRLDRSFPLTQHQREAALDLLVEQGILSIGARDSHLKQMRSKLS